MNYFVYSDLERKEQLVSILMRLNKSPKFHPPSPPISMKNLPVIREVNGYGEARYF